MSQTNKPQELLSTHGKWLLWAGSSLLFVTLGPGSAAFPCSVQVSQKQIQHLSLRLCSTTGSSKIGLPIICLQPTPGDTSAGATERSAPLIPVLARGGWDASSDLHRANHGSIYPASWVGFTFDRVLCSPSHASTLWAVWFQADRGLWALQRCGGSSLTKPSAFPKGTFPCGTTTVHFLVSLCAGSLFKLGLQALVLYNYMLTPH